MAVSHVTNPLNGVSAAPPDPDRSRLPEKFKVNGAACATEATPTRTALRRRRRRVVGMKIG